MSRITWSPERIDQARRLRVLRMSYEQVAAKLAEHWGEPVTPKAVARALERQTDKEDLADARAVRDSYKAGPPLTDDFEITVEAPPPAAPATRKLDELTDDDKTKLIANLIPEAARASGVEPSDCTWEDFRAYCSIAWGESDYGIARRHITRVGGFNRIRDAHYPKVTTDYAIERRELLERATSNRTEARQEEARTYYLKQVEEVAARTWGARPLPPEGKARSKPAYDGARMVSALLSDLHLDPGSKIVGFDERGQCRRLGRIAEQLLSYKPQYRAVSDCHLFINGDVINNWLHGREGAHPAVQACSAADKLAQMVRLLAASYNRVIVDFSPGNHDRDMFTDPKRALENKTEGHILTIGWAVRMACRELQNVTVNLPKAEIIFNHFGTYGLALHGDTVFGQITPRTLDTNLVEYVVNRYNAACSGQPVKLVLLGHWHSGMMRNLDNGVIAVINGSLVPVNEHARSLAIFEASCGQWIWESVPGHIWGDCRYIRVGQKESQDAALDGYITPFPGF